jgi:hypothetical protein
MNRVLLAAALCAVCATASAQQQGTSDGTPGALPKSQNDPVKPPQAGTATPAQAPPGASPRPAPGTSDTTTGSSPDAPAPAVPARPPHVQETTPPTSGAHDPARDEAARRHEPRRQDREESTPPNEPDVR